MREIIYKTILVSITFFACVQVAGHNDTAMKDTIQAASITAMRNASTAIIAKVEHADIRPILAPFGGSDAIGYVKFLPGIASGVEGSNSFYVRGGNNGNNLVTIDGVTL